jgi:preprotein translocase subunit SecE
MGRIQKKKTTAAKKKMAEKRKDQATSSGQGGAAPSQLTGGTSGTASKLVSLKKTSGPAKPAAIKQKKNFIDKSMQFLREVRVELKKVTWPSRKQTVGSTAVVIVLVMIISLFLGAVDFGLSNLIRLILH